MVYMVAPTLWRRVYELGVAHGRPGLFYFCMAFLQFAKLLLSFMFLSSVKDAQAN